MKICFEFSQGISPQAGIGNYISALLDELLKAAPDDYAFGLFFFDFLQRVNEKEFLAERRFDERQVSLIPFRKLPARFVDWLWARDVHIPGLGIRYDADIYHSTSHTAWQIPKGKKLVSTIHDMSPWRFSNYQKALDGNKRSMELCSQKSSAIITDSHFAAADILRFLPETTCPIFPIHLGINHERFFPQSPETINVMKKNLGLERPYLLTVGSVHPNKNQEFLGSVFNLMDRQDIDLVIAGNPWVEMQGEAILQRLSDLPCSKNIKIMKIVPGNMLPALYAGAELYVTASKSEGFGLTPLEAMACGTPVVSSAEGSLPEVLGDSAVVVRNFNPEDWCEIITSLLNNTTERHRLSVVGREWVKRYTWESTAKKTLEVYRSL